MEEKRPADGGDLDRGEEKNGEESPLEKAFPYTQEEFQRLQDLALSCIAEKVTYHNMEMKILWANQAACDFYGLPLNEIVGNNCYELLQRSIRDCHNCPVKKALQTRCFHQDVLSFPEGKTLLINAYPAWDDGKFTGVVEVSLDITERTRIEEELREAKDRSAAANLTKTRFLASVSHEIRTPLNVILGMANLIRDSSQSGEQKEYLDMIKDSASYLLTLVNDLLDLSKIEAGRIELAQDPFNLRQEVEKIVRSLTMQAQEKGLNLICSIDDNVPGIVTGDAARLHQVLVNLIGNGIKFTERGGVTVNVSLDETEEGMGHAVAAVLFSISDTGIGIPSDKLGQIFQDFSQADSYLAHKHEGAGLGLPICKNLVELMGGSLGVKSEENRGTTFYFTIPFDLPQDTGDITGEYFSAEPGAFSPAEASEAPEEQSPGREERGLEILLVEDKPMSQKMAAALLENKGHRVTAAKTGREALEALQKRRFDFILMDIHMPEMDGLEATAHIRAAEEKSGGHTPIAAMTAYAMQEDRDRCLQAGMDYYISKPLNAEELYHILEKVRQGKMEDLS